MDSLSLRIRDRRDALIVLRWAVVALAPLMIMLSGPADSMTIGILIGFAVYTLWLGRLIRRQGRLPIFAIVLDTALVSALIYVRNPLVTDAHLFYYIIIIMAGFSYGFRVTLLTCMLALLGYGTAAWLAEVPPDYYSRLAIRSIYFILFAWLSGHLAYVEHLTGLAYRDPLTGVANRRRFFAQLEQVMEAAALGHYRVAVLFLDLDRFKEVNDRFGHEAGDQVLQVVARRLEGGVRSGDTVARMGGDEFAVIMSRVEGRREAYRIAQRLKEMLGATLTVEETDLEVTVSIGVAVDDGSSTPAALVRNADRAMYAGGKGRGVNDVRIIKVGGELGTDPGSQAHRDDI